MNKIDNAFLMYAYNIIAETNKGLSGAKVIDYCNKYAIDFNVIIPVDNPEMLKTNYKPKPNVKL